MSYLSIFCFSFLWFRRTIPQNYCYDFHKSVLLMFSSMSFMIFGITLRSLISFEFIFVYSFRECSNFILLHVVVKFPQHHLLKRLFHPHYIFLLLCHKLIDLKHMGLLLGYLFFSIDLYVCPCASKTLSCLLWLCNIV